MNRMKIVLASGSAIRKLLLENAGLDVETSPAGIDEAAVKSALLTEGNTQTPADVALVLAQAKARTVSQEKPGKLTVGADQVLAFEDRMFSKPDSREDARNHLLELRGKHHELISAVAVARDGGLLWSHRQNVVLHMREFSGQFLERYLAQMEDEVTESVGGYKLEGLGVQLFDRIDGDYFTVLGLPLLALLSFLRTESSALV